jgi:selenocysteine lyase/cysteine desulfurase
MDWNELRELFPATQGQAYLNCATYGPAARPVLDAMRRAQAGWSSGRGSWLAWEAEAEGARSAFARLLRTSSDNVALLPAVSVAAGQVAENVPFTERANLVVGEGEFRSNLFAWLLQERRGFEIRTVASVDGRMPAEDWLAAIDANTACVAVSSVQSSNGYRVPLAPLIEACRSNDARLFVDGTQSVGALDIDLDGIDFLAVGGYKWLLGPRGTAYLYVAPHRLEELSPLSAGWKTSSEPYAGYYGPPLDLAPRASRLDVSLAWLDWVGAAPGLELILGTGIERVEAHDLGLAAHFRAGLASLGLESSVQGGEGSQIVGLRLSDPDKVRQALEREQVVAAVRGGYLRVSFHAFNNEDDVERALAALRSVVRG